MNFLFETKALTFNIVEIRIYSVRGVFFIYNKFRGVSDVLFINLFDF